MLTFELAFDNTKSYDEKIDKVVELIKQSKHTVVLTGAGISTDSGIPDFRSQDGLYSKYPSDILSINYFKNNPDYFYEAFNEKFSSIITAKPNQSHMILADWEQRGLIHRIITQNIDGLHQKAGNQNVYEMHGSISKFYYMNGNDTVEVPLSEALKEDNTIEYKKTNDYGNIKILKPDVVLFGENVKYLNESIKEVKKETDLVLVLGTSLQVYPFAELPNHLPYEKYSILINKEPIQEKFKYSVELWEDLAATLKEIDTRLKN